MKSIVFNGAHVTPSKIVCIGRNFVEHAQELGNEVPNEAVFFIKPNSSITEKLKATHGETLHYETELCFLILNQELAGVGIGLDLTKRQLQSKLKAARLPWERAKAFDGSAIFSKFIPTSKNTESLRFQLEINGNIIQQGDPGLMLFKPQSILAECKSFMSLEDGDIIMTGTPKGVGELESGKVYTASLFDGQELLIKQTWHAE